tara:strand:- start:1 stop:279 length:279 start_codon:yes stop_codon:yes gene_type:complete
MADKKRFGRDKAEAQQAKQKRQARFTEMCKAYKKANPTATKCKLTAEQETELKAMVSKVQGAINRQNDPNYVKTKEDKATIQKAYTNKPKMS